MASSSKKTKVFPLIFDTDVLVWYLRGHPKARELLKKTPREYRWLTSLSFMELLQGCRSMAESIEVQAFVAENFSKILHPRTSVSEKAIHLVAEHSLARGLQVIDGLIASCALLSRSILVTANKKHFHFIPGLRIQVFIPSETSQQARGLLKGIDTEIVREKDCV